MVSSDNSSIRIEITIDEYWIDHFLFETKWEIPVNEKISLTNFRISLDEGWIRVRTELKGKKTGIEMTCRPVWDPERQYLSMEDLDIHMSSKSVVLKSAGWFAKNFMNAKIDRKLEEQANKLYAQQIEKLTSKPLKVPGPKGGTVEIIVSSIHIRELTFREKAIHAGATVNGYLKLHFG